MSDRMPIMIGRPTVDMPKVSIPMAVLNEEWAQKNHGQSLTRLAERGGLSPCEAVAIIERRPWRKMDLSEAIAAAFSAATKAHLTRAIDFIQKAGHLPGCGALRCRHPFSNGDCAMSEHSHDDSHHTFWPGKCGCGHDKLVGV